MSAPSATVTVSGGAPATVTITTQPAATVQSGITFAAVPVVTVTDGAGNVVPSQAVTVAVSSGSALTFSNATATTNASGVATFTGLSASGLVGDRTLQFTAGTAVSPASSTVTVTAGAAATVTISTQPSATVQSGVTFPTVPVVTVRDAATNLVSSQLVTVSVASGGALTFTNGSATTNGSGVATFSGLSAAGLVGVRTLEFTAGAVLSAASNNVTVNAGLPAAVAITTQPAGAVQSGVAFPTVPVVTVTDGSGNLVPSQAVTVSVASGSALTFTNGTATTDGNGVATFTGLVAAGLAGDRTLRFTAGTAQSAASTTVTVSGGAPATVAITTQPSATVRSGVTFTTVPVVTVTDGAGNPVPNQAVTVSVVTGGALTFTNGSATTDINGVATFTGLAADGLIGTRTLRFTAGTALSAASGNVAVTAGLPATVTITTQPAATVQSGVVFPNPVPAVTVRDAATNLVPTQVVTVSVASGSALTFTNGSATTNASGVATFTGLIATGTVGIRTLAFTAGTAVSVASNNVTVNGGPPTSVVIATQPAAVVQSGVAFPTVPVVTVTDAGGNPVSSQPVTVSVVPASGGALTFTNGTATTDGTGTATFAGLSASGLIGNRTLRFTAGTAVSAASTTVAVTPGLPATVTITTQPAATVQTGVVFPTVPVVTVRDAATNLVPNQPVTVSVATGGVLTFTNGTATTSAVAGPTLGQAPFTGLVATGLLGARTLLFTAGTAVSVASTSVNVTAGPLAQLVVTPATSMLLTAGATKQLTATPLDAGGNTLTGQPAPTWTTSSASIATVSATGLVTAGATNGTATITATIGSVSGTALVMMGQVAVVTNNLDRTVSVLNGTAVQATPSVGNGPLDVAITPDGLTAWVLNNNGSNINRVTLGTNAVSAPMGSSNPRGVSIDPAGAFAFVVRGALDPSLSVFRTSDNAVVTQVLSGKSPRYVVATATDVWVTDSGRTATNGQVMRYNRSSGFVTDSVMVGNTPYGIDVTPNGQFLYVADLDSNTVSVINTGTLTRVATIAVGTRPWGVKVTPNGQFVYVANSGSNTVSVIATASNTVTATVTVGSNPRGLAITAAGDLVYVANSGCDWTPATRVSGCPASGAGTVSRIATATNTLFGSNITVGSTPSHIALRSVQ